MWRLVTVKVKGYAPWADDANQRTSYNKRAFAPWNIIMMGRGSISVSPLGIRNKGCVTTNILSPIRDLETKPLYLNMDDYSKSFICTQKYFGFSVEEILEIRT